MMTGIPVLKKYVNTITYLYKDSDFNDKKDTKGLYNVLEARQK